MLSFLKLMPVATSEFAGEKQKGSRLRIGHWPPKISRPATGAYKKSVKAYRPFALLSPRVLQDRFGCDRPVLGAFPLSECFIKALGQYTQADTPGLGENGAHRVIAFRLPTA